jgi:acetyl esterase/lipase
MTNSWQASLANALIKTFVRRRSWGNEEQVARRARRLLGSPRLLQWLKTRDLLRVEQVKSETVCGEWLIPKNSKEEVVLYFHGGGYVSCSAASYRPITAALARLSGCKVFSLDYRLAPEHRFPAAFIDATTGYRWLLEQNFRPNQIALVGDSAGGGLTLSVLLKLRDAQQLPLPACAVCFSPWTDLAGTSDSVKFNDYHCAFFHSENIKDFAAAYLGVASPLDPFASPVFAEFGGLPPVLLHVGSTEILLDDARRIHHKIQKAGGVSQIEIYDEVPHCWQMFDGFIPEARISLKHAATFISQQLLIKN